MKCSTGVEVYVSRAKTIRKKRFSFYYTFTAYEDELKLRLFEVGTSEPFLEHHQGRRESRAVLFLSPGYCDNRLKKGVYDKLTLHLPELQKLRRLKDVEVPEEVLEAARQRLKRLKI